MIKPARWRAELKQADVARALDMNSGHISQVLSGKRPIGIKTAKRIAEVYKDDIPNLTFGSVIEMTPKQLRKLFGLPALAGKQPRKKKK